jgi:predicted DNA-binding transcriptional regulator AlpA
MTSTTTSIQCALLDKGAVATLLGVSARHVDRLRARGAMPPPVKLGSAVRWARQTILDWISQGCPDLRQEVRQ